MTSTQICKKCRKTRGEVAVLIPYQGQFICDACVLESNRKALKELRKNRNEAASKKSRLNKISKNENTDDFDGDIEPDDDIMTWSPLHPVEDEAIDRIVNRVQKSRAAERKDLSKEYFDPDAVALLPRSIAEQFCLIPIRKEGNELMVAFSDPSDEEALTEVVNMTGLSIAPVVADADEIEDAIEKYYEY